MNSIQTTVKKRFLLINSTSPYFLYIPMGSFGLCDYLQQRDIEVRMINPALYKESEVTDRLLKELNDFSPTHIGFALHWQETADGFLAALQIVRDWKSDIPTFCGGFTAGYFGESLLKHCPELDYVIQGDPEEPLCQLISGNTPESVPNLFFRINGKIQRSDSNWLISNAELDDIYFTRLEYLADYKVYIERINLKLGFPVFVGRGCVFNCEYCGGSTQAFSSHSNRMTPAIRSIEAILRDLKILKEYTDWLYLCYEIDPKKIVELFEAIADEKFLRGHFSLNYGAWHTLDQNFLHLYKRAFHTSKNRRPLFELSPEVYSDSSRAQIKRTSTYTIAEMIETIGTINHTLEQQAQIEIFFSRYHKTEPDTESIKEEIFNIYKLKHQMMVKGHSNVRICYGHLSTDVGSRYWESYIEEPKDFSTLLHLKKQVDKNDRFGFAMTNLCLYLPKDVSSKDLEQIEALAFGLQKFEESCLELFHILIYCFGEDWLKILTATIITIHKESPSVFFSDINLSKILQETQKRFLAKQDWHLQAPFSQDLFNFSHKKISLQGKTHSSEEVSIRADKKYVMNLDAISTHSHDYLNLLSFLKRIADFKDNELTYERTVYIFLSDQILAIPHKTYRNTLKILETPCTIDDYLSKSSKHNVLNIEDNRNLLTSLHHSSILLPVED